MDGARLAGPGMYLLRTLILTLGVMLAMPAASSRAAVEPVDVWHWRHPYPQGNPLFNVSFCGGSFFALGPRGTLLVSSNGSAWDARLQNTPSELRDVTQLGSLYVLVGGGGLVLTSTDGSNWVERASGTFNDLLAVTSGAGQVVAVGDQGTILTSVDGVNWVRRTSGGTVFHDVAWNGASYMAVGYNPTVFPNLGSIYTSPDGIVWTRRSPPFNGRFNSVTVGNGLFVVVGGEGNILSSSSGANWSSQSSDFYRLQGVTRGTSTFVAVGSSAVYASTNGLQWLNQNSFPTESDFGLAGTAYGNGRFVAVSTLGTIFSSANGAQWTNHTSATTSTLRGLAEGNGAQVAVGDGGTILFSTNGGTWQPCVSGTGDNLSRVAFGNGRFVAVGAPRRALVSTNAFGWILADTGADEYLFDLAFGSGRFVAVSAAGGILTSTNGVNWLRNAGSGTGLNGVTWADGQFYVVGDFGTLLTSPDGLVWTQRPTGSSLTFSSFASGNGLHIIVGDFGLILTSTNLNDWIRQSVDSSLYLRSIRYSGGRFVVAGLSFGDPVNEGHILTSTDGAVWTFRNDPALSTPLHHVGYSAGTFFVLGEHGTILQSDPSPDILPRLMLARGSDGRMNITVLGLMGKSYRIESAGTLGGNPAWQTRATLPLPARLGAWIDPVSPADGARFYRAFSLP